MDCLEVTKLAMAVRMGFACGAARGAYCALRDLQNVASVAGLMITTEAMFAELPKDEAPSGGGGGMGGMGGMDGMM